MLSGHHTDASSKVPKLQGSVMGQGVACEALQSGLDVPPLLPQGSPPPAQLTARAQEVQSPPLGSCAISCVPSGPKCTIVQGRDAHRTMWTVFMPDCQQTERVPEQRGLTCMHSGASTCHRRPLACSGRLWGALPSWTRRCAGCWVILCKDPEAFCGAQCCAQHLHIGHMFMADAWPSAKDTC